MPSREVVLLLTLLGAASAAGQGIPAAAPTPETPPRLVASPEPGWPQWRGPRRDGRC